MKISIPLQSIPSHVQLHGGGFEAGFFHPVLGFDHLLAMIAVGMISTLYNKNAIFTVPAAFVFMMFIGSLFGIENINFLNNELAISLSLLVLGIAILLKRNLPFVIAIITVGFFGFFHGHAHGLEIPTLTAPYKYVSGFILATVLLHISGIVIALFAQRFNKYKILSILALIIICGGIYYILQT